MKSTQQLHAAGQSLWFDNITRDHLQNGTLKGYIENLSVTGLTSNPTIFNHAIKNSLSYDTAIAQGAQAGKNAEETFFALAIEDLKEAASLFHKTYEKTHGTDGWVSLEVSPLLAYDTEKTVQAAQKLHAEANRPNLFIKIPGTKEGLPAIEESIFRGIPVNVTLLFSMDQYLAAANAYLKGVERRIEAGLSPWVNSVASLFISRWDVAVADKVPAELKDKLGITVGKQSYKAYLELINSSRYLKVLNAGGCVQRLLFASTGTKDPKAADTLYVEGLAAPFTINTMPEKTLLAFADHGTLSEILTADGGDSQQTLAAFTAAGVDLQSLAQKLQEEGAASFVKSWNELIEVIEEKLKNTSA